ncbi:two-component regulator propeller domain-containing protein [Rhizobium calliandrae]|uniref:Two-component regulator propeller domain-containing protein n=1 Tax=Rhizobium calliandrae TaxID=1312182 RepID=A0ABT7KGL7_9HYPH|nr:sensor histidine kinase [Rhizobium calliandrae]MDL2407766.1 two-component regulator propeller domain-containing protein [Rhizobium calliandrae]
MANSLSWSKAFLNSVRTYKAIVRLAVLLLIAAPLALSSRSLAFSEPSSIPVATTLPEVVSIPISVANDIRFRRLNVAQGLSQTRVSLIIQDDDGYIWFGTQYGVNRFDGHSYRVFKNEPNEPNSLSGSYIFALFKGKDGTVWVGSDQGLDAFDKTTETFKHFVVDKSNPVVNHISEDPEGNLWLSTADGLYRLDPKTSATVRFQNHPGDPGSLASSDVKSTGFDRQGIFWVVNSKGLDAFDRRSGKVTARIPLEESVREFYFHEDRFGVFWIIHGSGNGLATFDRAKNEVTQYSFYPDKLTQSNLTGVYSILETHDGTIWLATMGAGLLKFDRQQKRFVAYQTIATEPESIGENRVIALFEDAEGNVWTGLHATPPNFFPVSPLPFESFRPLTPFSNAFGETLVNAIFYDSRGRIWIGGGGALTVIDRKTHERKVIDPLQNGSPVEVLSILEAHDGTFWVGTLGTGLLQLDTDGRLLRTFRHDPSDSSSISSDIVGVLVFDPAGKLWATTWNGIVSYDQSTGQFKTYKYDPSADAEVYHALTRQHDGLFWLGSSDGLYSFDSTSGKFARYSHSPTDPSSLSNNSANNIYVDKQGIVWIATQDGLNRFDPSSRQFKRYYESDGLPGGVVSCILEDADNHLWMSTNQGIARFDKKNSQFENFTTADGLPGNDLTGWDTCYTNADGEMFFGGFSGAAAVKPQNFKKDTYVPPLVFTELRLREHVIQPGTAPLTSGAIGHVKRLNLSPTQNDFSISFSALSYRNPETHRYRYRLVGLDDRWQDVRSGDHSINFFSMPHGSFRLELQASTGRGPWLEPPAVLDIDIAPAWWETMWFRGLCTAVLVIILAGLYRYRLRQMARTFDIRLAERVGERNRIARELHDSLLQGVHGLMFSLQAVRNLLPEQPDKALALFDIALEKGDQAILEGRNAVHDLRDSYLTEMDLSEAIAQLTNELEKLGPQPPPTIEVAVEGETRHIVPAVRDEVYRVAREALRNAIVHSGATRIECEFVYGRHMFSLRVGDNGKGLDERIVDAGVRKGHWGLPGMRERAESIGGTMEVLSRSGRGTEIVVNIPAKTAYA